ncbi:hypothetical protein Pcinc_026068 [Petrolisthes cinctipes]|uniref:CLIP domain-containing serine protease n=1 Tax=Petrolisthes cinctipes TaxID=88211 RepID=A0AAE1F997_PETCI|nr:hypothetical protein Pcinc_026068 [Petrolisthes cinctipes]
MEMQSVFCGSRSKGLSFSLLLLFLLHLTTTTQGQSALGANKCPRPCVSLRQCPQLASLLSNPTPENINTLRAATCRIVNKRPLLCCPASVLPRKCGRPFNSDRIFGGVETTLGTKPWMAALGYSEPGVPNLRFLCGGSVINERYILTAAHCVHSSILGSKRLEVVRLGEWDLKTEIDCTKILSGTELVDYCAPPAQNYTVEEVTLHPLYNTRADHSDDIALLRLNQTIDFSLPWIHPVCLPPLNFDVRKIPGTPEPEVAGWGFTENGTTSQRMLTVSIPFVDTNACNITYAGQIIDDQMCLGGRAGEDSCSGDSGGPLVVLGPNGPPYLQIGVVSYGPINCGRVDIPGVYTAVSRYRTWIEEHMKP